MNEITLGSPAYRQLARRFARLVAFSRARGLWPDEREELERIGAAMDYAEARHGRGVGNAVQATVSSLAMAIMNERHEAGHDIHIPSLGITISGKQPSIADVVDDYTFAVGQAGNLGGTES